MKIILLILLLMPPLAEAKHRRHKAAVKQQVVYVFHSQDRECPAIGVKAEPRDRILILEKPVQKGRQKKHERH